MDERLTDSLRKGIKDRDRKIETQRQEIERLTAERDGFKALWHSAAKDLERAADQSSENNK